MYSFYPSIFKSLFNFSYSLTVGSAQGLFRDLFSKVKAIDAKHGKFDLVLCIGDFFGPLPNAEDVSESEDELSLLLNGSLEGSQISSPLPETGSVYSFVTL